ncbi:MAG: hypothetical protein JRJ83_14855 [Deltaproteobacteria bacterium]|nr:hypothetical protein [Deltaproteobacteria bacterium]
MGDRGNFRIQVFDLSGDYLDQWGSYGSGDQEFKYINGICADAGGNVHVAERSENSFDPVPNRIKVYDPQGNFIRKWGFLGRGDGQFYSPNDVAVHGPSGMVLVTDLSSRIQVFSPLGVFLSRWGSQSTDPGFFDRPRGIAVDDTSDKVFVVDSWNNRIQAFTRGGAFRFMWGEYEDPPAGDYNFHHPNGAAVANGELYIADAGNNDRIMVFDLDGRYLRSWGSTGTGAGQFNMPVGIAVCEGKVYVADLGNNRIQVFNTMGTHLDTWSTYDAGTGPVSYSKPWGVAIYNGRVYVTEYYGHRVVVLDIFGNYQERWGSFGTGQGEFNRPAGIAVDGLRGLVYVADSMNDRVQVFSPEGAYLASVAVAGSEPGQVLYPVFVTLDENGYLYASEEGANNRVQIFKPLSLFPGLAKAAIVAGGGPYAGNNLWDATQLNANFAYRTLIYQGYTPDTIQYLSGDTDLDLNGDGSPDVDEDVTNESIRDALLTWSADADSLLLYMVGHGGDGLYRTNATEILAAGSLGQWINEAASRLPGGIKVIYDACESGSLMPYLAVGEGSVVMTSTSPGESADFVSLGSLSFSNEFWTGVFNGQDVRTAFEHASRAMGEGVLSEGQHQHPLMDADGDGTANEAEDFSLTEGVFIGSGVTINPQVPLIGDISPEQLISGTTSALLYASGVTDPDGIARVWAVIRPPGYGQGLSDNAVQEFPSVDLMPDPVIEGRYEGTYTGLHTTGTYYVLIYATDRAGNASPPECTTISLENPLKRKAILVAGGSPPTESALENTDLAYNALRFQAYTDEDIYYLSNTVTMGWDGAASTTNLAWALGTWAAESTQDVVLYMVGEGGPGFFELADEDDLPPTHLDAMLDSLQASLPGPVTLIYDASLGGSFVPLLTPPPGKGRILISSTSGDQEASWAGIRNVSFSRFFWNQVANGTGLWQAHVRAKDALWYASGQEAWLDDTGDGIGNGPGDGVLARSITLGLGIVLSGDEPLVGMTYEGEVLNGTSSALLWAEDVTTTGTLEEVFAVITPPGLQDPFSGISHDPDILPLIYDAGNDRYQATYEHFDRYGTYQVAVYARDTDGKLSQTRTTTVTQQVGPDTFEEDDTPALARLIGIQHGSEPLYQAYTQTHTFHDQGDADWVRFYGVAGQGYEIRAENVEAGADPVLTLFDEGGSVPLVLRDDGGPGEGEILSWLCPAEGPYLLRATQADPTVFGEETAYDLKIFMPLAGEPGTLWGLVLDELGRGVGDAWIRIQVNETTVGTPSLDSGYYRATLPSGTWAVNVEATGYYRDRACLQRNL